MKGIRAGARESCPNARRSRAIKDRVERGNTGPFYSVQGLENEYKPTKLAACFLFVSLVFLSPPPDPSPHRPLLAPLAPAAAYLRRRPRLLDPIRSLLRPLSRCSSIGSHSESVPVLGRERDLEFEWDGWVLWDDG